MSTLPAVLLVIYWWKRGRLSSQDVLPLLPFFVAGIALGRLTIWMETHHVGAGQEWSLTLGERPCYWPVERSGFTPRNWPTRIRSFFSIHAGRLTSINGGNTCFRWLPLGQSPRSG